MLYQIGKGCIIRLADYASIPFDLENTDYQIYLAWVNQGNEPSPEDSSEPSEG
jgi:hypothetical protein